MNMTREEFAKLYRYQSLEKTGSNPSDTEIDENYRYYVELVDLTGEEGSLDFMLDDRQKMTWEFTPRTLSPNA